MKMIIKNYKLTNGELFSVKHIKNKIIFFTVSAFAILVLPTITQARQVRFYGVDNANAADFTTLKQYGINLVQVIIGESEHAMPTFFCRSL